MNDKKGIIFGLMILAASVFFMISKYETQKQDSHLLVNSATPAPSPDTNLSLNISGYAGKLVIPPIASEKSAATFQTELNFLKPNNATNFQAREVQYENGKNGYEFNFDIKSNLPQPYFDYFKVLYSNDWKLLGGIRDERSAIIEIQGVIYQGRIEMEQTTKDNIKVKILLVSIQ